MFRVTTWTPFVCAFVSLICCTTERVGSDAFSFQKPVGRAFADRLENDIHRNSFRAHDQSVVSLCMARQRATSSSRQPIMIKTSWYPRKVEIDPDDIFADVDDSTEELEEESIALLASLIQRKLDGEQNPPEDRKHKAISLAKGRFLDLTCSQDGETLLEKLFDDTEAEKQDEDVIRGAVIALQSLLVMGTQTGVKGSPKQLDNNVAHLRSRADSVHNNDDEIDLTVWDFNSIRKLKLNLEVTAGTQLLAEMLRKRASQGAYELLIQLGAWEKHENVVLLRSGFPIRFTAEESEAAVEAEARTADPDELLGLRKDLREQKIYTIDSASTSEIDDGLSIEVLTNKDGSTRYRYWIHIADADHWAPRNSNIYEIALRRSITHYLPDRVIPMFPPLMSEVMSLSTNKDLYALSLGVELLPDGSIDTSSIIVTPSLINVSYRLTYDEVDEMLEEGVGYSEEWQLGALLETAKLRREHRVENGSTEGFVPNPIPQSIVKVSPDEGATDGLGISVSVDASQNPGKNQTLVSLVESNIIPPMSPAFMLVTEMMIMAGEAMPKWKLECDKSISLATKCEFQIENNLELPFRSQGAPDFKSRQREVSILNDLREGMQGGGYCHAWYARRFFKPVSVTGNNLPHYGMGLDCYVQWSSPIRRFGDLQVHWAVKRYLRLKRINEMMASGMSIPQGLSVDDLGCNVPKQIESSKDEQGKFSDYLIISSLLGNDVQFKEKLGLVKASRIVQRKSNEYWTFEHLDRLLKQSPDDAVFDAVVLGCVNPDRLQYAVYIHELALEHRYLSELGELKEGQALKLRVISVNPGMALLTLTAGK